MSFNTDMDYGKLGEMMAYYSIANSPHTLHIHDVSNVEKYFEEDVDIIQVTKDFKVNKYEVKTDSIAHKTGNLFYEKTSKGNVGCLERTKADYIVYVVPMQAKMFVMPTIKLREYINSKERATTFINDDDKTSGYLISLKVLVELGIAKVVDVKGLQYLLNQAKGSA